MDLSVPLKASTCFFERDPDFALWRRAITEGVGTLLLMFVVTGSGLIRLHLHGDAGLGLIASAIATSGALVGLILAFGPASGGHFNPLITGTQWLAGERKLDCAVAYVLAQLVGGIAGASLANVICGSVDRSSGLPVMNWLLSASETVAAAGLMTIVFGSSRGERAETGPFAVGAWLVAAIIATPSTAYANPAIAIAAIFATGPVALPVATAIVYAIAEIVGALIAFGVIAIAYPRHVKGGQPTSGAGPMRTETAS
jgi:glycerol uptake facilitator-like aquaporin